MLNFTCIKVSGYCLSLHHSSVSPPPHTSETKAVKKFSSCDLQCLIAFIRVSIICHHHAGDSSKTGLPLNNSTQSECTSLTLLHRIWLNLISDCASLTDFHCKRFVSCKTSSSKWYQNKLSWKTGKPPLLEADYLPSSLLSSSLPRMQTPGER